MGVVSHPMYLHALYPSFIHWAKPVSNGVDPGHCVRVWDGLFVHFNIIYTESDLIPFLPITGTILDDQGLHDGNSEATSSRS